MNKKERVISAIFNIRHLVKGWSKIFTDLTEIQKEKLKICNECDFCVDDEWLDIIDKKITECKGTMCVLCGCPNVVLVRSNKKCKENKWEHIK